MWLNEANSHTQLHSDRILQAFTCCGPEYEWAVTNSAVTYFGIGLYLDWAYKPSSWPAKALWSGSRFCDYLHQSRSRARAECRQSDIIFLRPYLSPLPVGVGSPVSKKSHQILPGIEVKVYPARPRSSTLTVGVINRSLHLARALENPPWYHQDRNTPSCLAPPGLTKFSLNGLPGDSAAEEHLPPRVCPFPH